MIFEIPIFQLNFKNLIFFPNSFNSALVFKQSSAPLDVNKRERIFRNSRKMESVTLSHAKINGLWWGPHICDWSIDWLTDWLDYHAWLILLCSVTCTKLFLNCALTSLFDSLLWLVAQVRIYSHSCFSIYMFWFSYVHDSSGIHWFPHQLSCQLHFISRDSILRT